MPARGQTDPFPPQTISPSLAGIRPTATALQRHGTTAPRHNGTHGEVGDEIKAVLSLFFRTEQPEARDSGLDHERLNE